MLTHKLITGQTLDGEPVEVRVNALPLTLMEAYLAAEFEAGAVITLTTGVDPATLHPDTALAVVEAAEELNSPFAERLLARAQKLKARYEQSKPTPSPTSSRTSSVPAAPPTGTAPKA
jgi:predicted DNA-binding transcriptional regulator YafY